MMMRVSVVVVQGLRLDLRRHRLFDAHRGFGVGVDGAARAAKSDREHGDEKQVLHDESSKTGNDEWIVLEGAASRVPVRNTLKPHAYWPCPNTAVLPIASV